MMNKRGTNDIESYDEIHLSDSAPIALGISDSTALGNPGGDRESMYEAASVGNWEAAEKLLNGDPSLGCEEITDRGDRALHVAVCSKQTEFVENLVITIVNRWSRTDILELQDGHGYTACCYAAMTGIVARGIIRQNPNLCNLRNRHGTTPLQLAVLYGNASVVLHFLESARADNLSKKERFDLLLVSVRSKMYDVALKILENDGSLAVMTESDGSTALHVLAQLDISSGWKTGEGKLQTSLRLLVEKLWAEIQRLARCSKDRRMQLDLRLLLAEKLWEEIQKLGKDKWMGLMKKPPILHDAAKVGNVEVIAMITRDNPELLWHLNTERCSILHIAVMYRQEGILKLIKQASIKDFNAISQYVNGNNILHLAGKLLPADGLKNVSEPDLQMKSELAWFKEVEKIAPPFFLEQKNGDGYKPRELFWMEHKRLLEESVKHMKTTAECCMLVATIIITVVFAAAFAPPGGYNQETGIPIHFRDNWFASFVIFEVLALFSSTYSILTFWSIISSNYEEDQFLSSPNHLRHALSALLLSVLCAISAFLSTFFLVFVRERKMLVVSFMLPVYVWLVVGVSFQFVKLFPKTNLLEYYSRMGASPGKYSFFNDSLWRRGYNFGAHIVSSIWKFLRSSSSKENIQT